jgi:hypothetical protein
MKAILLRLLMQPHLLVRYKDYLHPDMFDIGDGHGALRKLAQIIIGWVREEKDLPTVDGVDARLQLLPDGEERSNVIALFFEIRTDSELARYSESDQVFSVFLQWLKAMAFMSEYHGVKEKFNSGSFDDAYVNLEKTLTKIKGITLDSVQSADWDTSLKFLEEESNRPDRKFLFGIEDFDSLAGFEPQQLGLFVAMTGGGKSMLSVHFIRQAIQQAKHIYVACVEDRKVTILRRVYAAITGIPMSDIKKLCDMPPESRKKMKEAAALLQKYVTIEFMYGQPLDFILSRVKEENTARELAGKPRFDAMVLDYLQHIAHLSPGDAMHEKLTNSMARYKDFALSNNMTCITHQQVNRGGAMAQSKESIITMADMSGSYQAAFVADVIISLNRTQDMKDKDEAVLCVLKGREGALDQKFQVKTEFARARFNFDDYVRLDKMS